MGGAERAVLEFHSQTANIANMLLEQFRELYGEELTQGDMDDSQKAIDERYMHSFFCMIAEIYGKFEKEVHNFCNYAKKLVYTNVLHNNYMYKNLVEII